MIAALLFSLSLIPPLCSFLSARYMDIIFLFFIISTLDANTNKSKSLRHLGDIIYHSPPAAIRSSFSLSSTALISAVLFI